MSSAPAADADIAPAEPAPADDSAVEAPSGPPASADRPWLWFWIAAVIAPLPMLVPYFAGLWQRAHYQYFPFVFIAVAGLVHARWNRRIDAPRGGLSCSLLLCGFAAVGTAVAIFSPWLGAVGFILIATAWLRALREADGRRLAILALPLLTLLRLPLSVDSLLIIRLQGWTTELASWLLDLVSIPHMTDGNIIQLTTRELFVAEACSGIQSVFTLLFMASLLVAYKRHPWWFAPFFGAAAVVLAVFSNALRVAIVAAAEVVLAVDWTTGLSHDAVGYFTLTIAGLLLLSFERCFSGVFHPVGDVTEIDQQEDNPLIELWNRMFPRGETDASREASTAANATTIVGSASQKSRVMLRTASIGLGLLLGLGSLLAVVDRGIGSPLRPSKASITRFFTPPPGMLDPVWDSNIRVDHEVARDGEVPRLGTAADVWTVSEDAFRYQVVLSQPYFGWHELCICYENLDWRLVDRSIVNTPAAEDRQVPEGSSTEYALARFRRDDGRHGYLLFSAITYDGMVSPPPPGLGTTAYLRQRFTENAYSPPVEMMMLQLWLEAPDRLRFEEVQKLKDRFLQARIEILREVRSSPDLAAATVPAP